MISNRSTLDQLADAAATLKAAQEAYDNLKDKVVEEYDIGNHEGSEKIVQIFLSQRSVTDFEKLERLYGVTEEQFKLYSACKKDGKEFVVVKIVDKKKGGA
jgi:dGTP triphosphohydrolase